MTAALLLLGGAALLYAGAEALVHGAGHLALRLGLSPLVIGLTVVAYGTSGPELAVSVQAALQGHGGIALGNVVGSNICNVALILGLAALVRPLSVHPQLVRFDVPLMVGCSLLLAALLRDGGLGRADGALLAVGIVAYTGVRLQRARREEGARREPAAARPGRARRVLLDALLVAGALALLVAGSSLFLEGAVRAAEVLGVSRAVVGLTIVALGTSLPELATSLVAALRGREDIALGNVVGSNLFNILAILGASALLRPFPCGGVGALDVGAMVAVALLVLLLMAARQRMGRWSGGVLLLGYAAYLGQLLA